MIGYVDGYNSLTDLLVAVIERARRDAKGELYGVPPTQREIVREEAEQFLSELQSEVGKWQKTSKIA